MDKKEARKTVRTFAWASFFNDMGSDMIYPIWPLFVTSVLGANMSVLGFIDGLGDALVSISQAVSGYISDRIKKRKVFVWIGYFCAAVSRIGYAFSTAWPQLIPFKILDRAGKIRGAPRDAIIADVSTDADRGKNFGILRAMDSLGAVFGILICILLVKSLGLRNLFLLAAVPSAAAVLLVIFLIKERKTEQIKIYKGISFKEIDANFKLFFLLNAVFSLGAFSYSFLLVYAQRAEFPLTSVPVLYLIFTIAAAVFSLPFGKLSDKIGRKPVLLISFALWALVCLCFILFRNHLLISAGFVLYGMHKAALETVQRAFVAELSPIQYRASSLGGFQMVIGLCALPASFIAGLLWDKVSIFAPFYFSLYLTVFAFFLLMFVKEKRNKAV